MMKKYNQLTAALSVPQTVRSAPNQVLNNAGGYVYNTNTFDQVLRFLIIGSDTATYYSTARNLTKMNIACLQSAIQEDYIKLVDLIVDVSVNARAPNNDTALYALAVVASSSEVSARRYAISKLNDVARTGTHLFHFVEYVNSMRGWGRLLKNAIANWYLVQSPDDLALQAVKYKQRDGWSHKDLLRLAHPKTQDVDVAATFNYIITNTVNPHAPKIIKVAQQLQSATSINDVMDVLNNNRVPREIIPTQWLNDTKVWDSMLSKGMPIGALIRNLGKISSLNMTKSNTSNAVQYILSSLKDRNKIISSKIHPIQILIAYYVYSAGKGVKGSLTWTVNEDIVSALNDAFYIAFGNVQATGKNILLALDVSGSMSMTELNGIPGLTPRVISAAMALVTYRIEPKCDVMAFSSGFIPVKMSKTMTLDTLVKQMRNMSFDSTDCSLPMQYAMKHNINYEVFYVYTDNETYQGKIHADKALRQVRTKFKSNAKLAVVGLTSSKFSIADPNDPGMLDFVGFDAALPAILTEFVNS